MQGLSAEVLRSLLATYETAIAELRAMRDRGVEGLIARLTRHRVEAISTLAHMNQ